MIFGILILMFLITISNNSNDYYEDIEVDEWVCPDCSFNVQLGIICPYCDTKKKEKL
tara:strand:+ start:253 stop:423 length:171 start_codon:yes stop_codon:yes gene_type:complete